MAIVINGSGTVTGLAVGGLPDGTVDAGTLATDSVTAAKLEASAITSADLPAGSVLQVVEADSLTLTAVNSTSFVAVGGASITITPSSSSSKIIIDFNTGSYSVNGCQNMAIKIKRGSTTVRTSERYTYSAISGDTPAGGISYTCLDSPSTTSATTYTVEAKVGSSSGTWYFNTADGTKSLIIRATEIAG